MKKLLFLCFCINNLLALNAQAAQDNRFSFPIKSKLFGYYLPLDFVNAFEKSKDWFSSRDLIKKYEYIHIRVDKNGIWVQEPITGDGFHEDLIDSRNGISDYRFEIKNGDDIIITSKKGEKYQKISNDFEDEIPAINNYIGRIVLRDFILSGEIILDNDIITIPALDFGKFRIETYGDYSEYYAHLYVYGFDRMWWLDMDIQDDIIIIYEYASWIWNKRTGKKIYWRNKE